jgi:hypothetical protein
LSSTFGGFWSSSSLAASGNTILLSILSQWTVLVLLNLRLRSQLKLAGESASKALLKAWKSRGRDRTWNSDSGRGLNPCLKA